MRRLRTVLGVLLADARAHKLQTLTTCVGVAVGVAVIVAIRLSSEAALDHFRDTVRSFTGEATHELVAPVPMPAGRLTDLVQSPGVEAAQPVIESTLVLRPGSGEALPVRLIGLDPIFSAPFVQLDAATVDAAAQGDIFGRLMREPGLVALPSATLAQLGVPDGGPMPALGPFGPLEIMTVPLESESLAAAQPPFALTDLATAQELLQLGEDVTRFDLIVTEGLADDIPLRPGERLKRPERRGERADTMTAAFRTNLLCLGGLAVLVGAFLAFNMAQFAVVRRRNLLGKLRCLGSPARTLMWAVLLEAGVLGAAGSLLGVALGWLLSREMVGDVARTVSTLYGHIGTPETRLDPLTAGLALTVGVVSTVAASWAPARNAARTSPALVAGRNHAQPPIPPWTLGVGLAALAGLLLVPDSAVVLPAFAVLALLLAVATGLPLILGKVVRRHPRLPVLALAFGRIERSLGRTGAAAGALAMPLAMTIAILVMVGSFRAEVTTWSESVLGADVYIKPLFQDLRVETARLSPELLAELDRIPGVRAVDRLRLDEQLTSDSSFLVAGSPLAATRERGSMRVLEGGSLDQLLDGMDRGETLVSEPLAMRLDLAPGDHLELDGQHGPERLRVAGVFQDFSWDRGYALLSETRYMQLFGDTGVRNAALLLEPGVDAEAFSADLAARFDDAEFRTVDTLRDDVMQAFNDTFAITYVLQSISTALALIGILTAVLCLHLERRSELGVLRALGARTRTIGQLLVTEALLLLGVAAAAAVPVGLGLAWILVSVVNTRSFGWSFPMRVDAAPVLGLMALALLAGLVAGGVPWWMVRRAPVADLLESRT